MSRDFSQIEWDAALAAECLRLVRTAIQEDLGRGHDWTTLALIPQGATGRAAVVARQAGVVAGLPAGLLLMTEIDPAAVWEQNATEGARIAAGTTVATIHGPARSLLVAERILLNLIGRLAGVATLTRRFVDAVAAVPGAQSACVRHAEDNAWLATVGKICRAARGRSKPSHGLVRWRADQGQPSSSSCRGKSDATAHARGSGAPRRSFLDAAAAEQATSNNRSSPSEATSPMLIEVEVDTLEQLRQVLPAGPDIVLLDNMSPADLHRAVQTRDATAPRN